MAQHIHLRDDPARTEPLAIDELFVLNGVKKLKDTGRMTIIQNGSSLFTGDAGSGQSEIRRYPIENDWLDVIVQLLNDSFYNTGIATYRWMHSRRMGMLK